jgi:hypothetical protein
MVPLSGKDARKMLPPEDYSTIFRNITDLLDVSNSLLALFKLKDYKGDPQFTVGQIFMRMVSLKMLRSHFFRVKISKDILHTV